MKLNIRNMFVLLLVVVPFVTVAQAETWSSTCVDVLYGKSYEKGSGNSEGNIITLEHAGGWEYGDNFFFTDIGNFDKNTISAYAEFAPRLSIYKIMQGADGEPINTGPLSDVLVVGQMDMGDGFRAYMAGVGTTFSIPKVQVFTVNWKYRDNPNLDGSTYQITPIWKAVFDLGPARILFKGFIDWTGREGDQPVSILAQPQLLLDIGHFWEKSDRLYLGTEYQFWSEKFVFTDDGVDYAQESLFQAMVKWVF